MTKPNIIHRTAAITLGLGLAATFVVAPAFADDPDPDVQDKSCRAAILDFGKAARGVLQGDAKEEANGLGGLYSSMRSSCAELRSCKRDCRDAKRDAKAACKGLRGKAKRKCKRNARKEKRACKRGCRSEMEASGCKDARRAFWGSLGKVATKVAKDKDVRKKGRAAIRTCKELYKKD